MTDDLGKEENHTDERGRANFLTIGLSVGLWSLLRGAELLPNAEALLVGYIVGYAVGYWLPPKPSENYFPYLGKFIIFITSFYLAFFKVPLLLKNWLSLPLAYGIPILVFFIFYALSMDIVRQYLGRWRA